MKEARKYPPCNSNPLTYLRLTLIKGVNIPRKKRGRDEQESSRVEDQSARKNFASGRAKKQKKEQPTVVHRTMETTTATTTVKVTKKKTRKTKTIDVGNLTEAVFEHVDAIFGFTTILGMSRDQAFEFAREIVELIASGYSSKPDPEAVIKKIKRNQKSLFEHVVARLLELIEKPTPQQLEYIITNGGKALLSETGKLYKLSVLYGMEELVDILRHVWNTNRGRGFVTCPKCCFNAIAPDRCCLICNYIVPEDYLRAVLGFDEKFNMYLKTASVAELNEVLQFGYVLLAEKGIYHPRSRRAMLENHVVYIVYLRKPEISRIIEEVNSRDLQV